MEGTLGLVLRGYRYISEECTRRGVQAFETRVMIEPVVCLRGAQAAQWFYDERYFARENAAPRRLQKTLTGKDTVQSLDGEQHRRRKALFLSFMGEAGRARLSALLNQEWREAIRRAPQHQAFVLYRQSQRVLFRAACRWTGVPFEDSEVPIRTEQLAALFEGAGRVGPGHWRARIARHRAEAWLARLILRQREAGGAPVTALHVFADHADAGSRLAPTVAAAEMLNVLRPIVAISVYLAFLARALHLHPKLARQIADGDDVLLTAFVLEVRRFYPFFPAVAARARCALSGQGVLIRQGQRVLLDLYGSNRDPAIWSEPQRFEPLRFIGRQPGAFELIPQGGGEHARHHRCAGEWITQDALEQAARMLTRELRYELPAQELTYSATRVPTWPRSGYAMQGLRVITRQ
jgi:fatty-acid peroxygenase